MTQVENLLKYLVAHSGDKVGVGIGFTNNGDACFYLIGVGSLVYIAETAIGDNIKGLGSFSKCISNQYARRFHRMQCIDIVSHSNLNRCLCIIVIHQQVYN